MMQACQHHASRPSAMETDSWEKRPAERSHRWRRIALWASGAWALPIFGLGWWLRSSSPVVGVIFLLAAIVAAPVLALLFARREERQLRTRCAIAVETTAQLKLQLDAVRFRTSRMREELQAADRQARLS